MRFLLKLAIFVTIVFSLKIPTGSKSCARSIGLCLRRSDMNIYFCKSGNYFSWVAASSSVAAKRRFVASYEPCTDVTCFVARQNVKCPAGPVDLGNIQR